MWTSADLQAFVKDKLRDYVFVVVSNREPYEHVFTRKKITWQRGAGGVVSALDPVMRSSKGIWVAFGSGDADRRAADSQGRVQVPPDNPQYTLKRVWLTKEEETGYYYGYSNEALWPLSHMAFHRPAFRQEDWDYYVTVNQKFAQAVLAELAGRAAFVWIQDYHLCLLPRLLKEMAPQQLIIAQFWHIPWPNHETFRICPHKKELLTGLLANDLLGFHIQYHCANFMDVVDRELECRIDRERFSIVRQEHETMVRPFPISIDFDGINERITQPDVAQAQKALAEEIGAEGLSIIAGVDRLDYTKGIPERFAAFDRLLEKHPELKGKVVFLQMGELSRMHISAYRQLNDELNALVEHINWKHSTDEWRPVILIRRHLSPAEMLALFRLCNVCVVSPLHDGMNLVAKEFVASRADGDAMLVLSRFAGAARELVDAILVNPFDQEQFSDGLYEALTIAPEERRRRMEKMRGVIREHNVFRWAGQVLADLLRLEIKA